jgi:hypothetical protein
METTYIEFDTSPTNEDCVSVSKTEDYIPKMKEEANRMVALLDKKFQNLPGYFGRKTVSHDFGSYIEIRYYFDDDAEGWASSNFVESNWPMTWNDDATCKFEFVASSEED